MGLDLRLLALREPKDLDATKAHMSPALPMAVLDFMRDYSIFGQIKSGYTDVEEDARARGYSQVVKPRTVPKDFKVFEFKEAGIIEISRELPDGEELTYATAGELGKIRVPRMTDPNNRAAIAYVRALPKKTPVIIRWC